MPSAATVRPIFFISPVSQNAATYDYWYAAENDISLDTPTRAYFMHCLIFKQYNISGLTPLPYMLERFRHGYGYLEPNA
jgi:hypothetical protein